MTVLYMYVHNISFSFAIFYVNTMCVCVSHIKKYTKIYNNMCTYKRALNKKRKTKQCPYSSSHYNCFRSGAFLFVCVCVALKMRHNSYFACAKPNQSKGEKYYD